MSILLCLFFSFSPTPQGVLTQNMKETCNFFTPLITSPSNGKLLLPLHYQSFTSTAVRALVTKHQADVRIPENSLFTLCILHGFSRCYIVLVSSSSQITFDTSTVCYTSKSKAETSSKSFSPLMSPPYPIIMKNMQISA